MVDTVTSPPPSRSFWGGVAVGTLLAVATVLLIVQNGASVPLQWLTLSFTAPMWLFLLSSAISGAVLALLALGLWRRARSHAKDRRDAAKRLRQMVGKSTPRSPGHPGPSQG
ncbi:lipopolysaccharide assembly protein LapA domain-containing protein [Nonomuraea sp. 10N515B]|uniref:lipopolysaccharide assembly protein LapA domain-containing protein n=1 Tax=Nonomuraea sp. 10N515B TaxID=3457422 RepID=UPI003FCE2BBD